MGKRYSVDFTNMEWNSLGPPESFHGAYIPELDIVWCDHCKKWIKVEDIWDNPCKHFKITKFSTITQIEDDFYDQES